MSESDVKQENKAAMPVDNAAEKTKESAVPETKSKDVKDEGPKAECKSSETSKPQSKSRSWNESRHRDKRDRDKDRAKEKDNDDTGGDRRGGSKPIDRQQYPKERDNRRDDRRDDRRGDRKQSEGSGGGGGGGGGRDGGRDSSNRGKGSNRKDGPHSNATSPQDRGLSKSKSDSAQILDKKGDGRGTPGGKGAKGDVRDRDNDKQDHRKNRDSGRKDSGSSSGKGKGKDDRGQGDAPKAKENDKESPSKEILNMLHSSSDKGKSGNKVPIKGSKQSNSKEIRNKGSAASELEAKWQKEEEEQRKKEEEEKRKIEEEQFKKDEEVRKAKEEEERKQREEEEAKQMLFDFINEAKEKIEMKEVFRSKNIHANEHRPDESFFSKLDSSLKKNTAFVKKLKNLTDLQRDSLTKDFNSLNLTKYVGEVATAITEAKLKMSDINCALHMASLMHQRYPEFPIALLEGWNKVLLSKKDEKIFNASKLRVDLRLFADLITVGVFTDKEGLPVLANQLTILISNDKEEHNNLSIILSFCRHCGDDYAGLLPRKYRLLAEKYEVEIPRSKFLPTARQHACRNLLKEYYSSLCRHLVKEHKDLRNMEKHNRKTLQTKGELSSERKEKMETAQQYYQKLYTNTCTYADLLDDAMPDLPEEEIKGDGEMGFDIFNPGTEYQYEGDGSLFEDDDTRVFYESLPDLKALVPGILYKDSEQAETTNTEESAIEEDLNIEDIEKEMEEAGKTESAEKTEGDNEEDITPLDIESQDIEEDDTDIGSTMKVIMENFLQTLPNCVNRELIDRAATDFCMSMNTKSNRKKLTRGLFTVHRTRYDLLPFYSRFVATLHPCMPDVSTDLAASLKLDFKWHVRKKDQINIESKLKTVRFIGELVKFKMFQKSEALHCIKMLMFDFKHHNIEMACALLETCGRYLYRSPESHHRTKVYLEVMMRKKVALHLDSRYNTMIENAYYYSNPPDIKQEARKIRPPMHEYIRKLLYKDLSKVTTEKVLRQIRKLSWDDEEVSGYVIRCLTKVWNIRYNSVHCAANLLAGLAPYHEEIAIRTVDGILEDVRLGMEINHPKFNQRRISAVKYLGELYNYRMVESAVIFKTLYSFISFGVILEDPSQSLLDPPEHLFRIRLVCVVLETCGQYFDKGSSKKKLDCFIVYFQRYFWFKKSSPIWSPERPFPMDVDYLFKDQLETLRPKFKMSENYEQACKEAEVLDKEFKAKIAAVLPIIESEDASDTNYGEDGLPAIQETDEAEELSLSLSQVRFTGDTGDTGDTGEEDDEDHSTQDSETEGEHMDGTTSGGQSQSLGHGQSQNAEEYDYEEDMYSAGEMEEDDNVTVLTGGPKHMKCSEDEDFMAEFDKMMIDNLAARNNEGVKVPQLDIAVPMHLKGQKDKKVVPPIPGSIILEEKSIEEIEEEPKRSVINFTLLTKRGNKQQLATLNVPLDAKFATRFKEREQAEKAEKDRMKQLVLDINDRQEEEDYQEMIAAMSKPATVNTNRERRAKYQHPKGAPDADLIFGSKKR